LAQSNRLEQAEQNFRRAITLLEELEQESPTAAHWRELALQHTNLANLLAAAGGASQELHKCRRRLATWQEKLATACPNAPVYHADLARTFNDLAEFALRRNRPADAYRDLQKAIHHQRTALELRPQESAYRRSLCNHYLLLLEAFVEMDDHAAAAIAVTELT